MSPFEGSQNFNDFALISQSALPTPWLIALCGIVLAAGGYAALGYLHTARNSARRRDHWGLAVLHSLATLGLVAFILQPAIDWRLVSKVPGRIAIVVDDSLSMGTKDEAEESRFAAVQRYFVEHKSELDEWAKTHEIEWYSLHGSGRPSSPTFASSPVIDAVLKPLRESASPRPLVSVVLASDGADTSDAFSGSEALRRERLAPLITAGVPVNVLSVGADGAYDLFVERVAQDAVAFVRNTARIEVVIGRTGRRAAASVPVSLQRDGELLAQQNAAFSADSSQATVSFEMVPDRVGEFVYTVVVPTDRDDSSPDNNRSEFILRVVRDKIRVLLVVGRPSWDQRFLRRALRTSPNVDLISFFILRTPTDYQDVPNDELSLIPFPTNELFNTELHTFDVVVFDNFDYRPYRMGYLLQNVREHVLNGGALVMFGGEASFGGGAYGQTPLADILPVRMSDSAYDDKPFRGVVTPAGDKHPVLRLHSTPASDSGAKKGGAARQKWIDQLPEWPTSNDADGLAPQATALLVHPTRKAKDGTPLPVVAVRDVGKGRTMAVLTDGAWRWAFTDKMRGDTGQAYERFLSQTLRWLMHDPDVGKLKLEALPPSAADTPSNQRRVSVVVRAFGSDYLPKPNVAVSVRLTEGQRPTLEQTVTTGDDGTAVVTHDNTGRSVLRVVATAQTDDEQHEASLLISSSNQDAELRHVAARPAQLEWMATTTSGVAQPLAEAKLGKMAQRQAEITSVDRHQEMPLWSTWPALLLVVALLSAEWWLRRRRGYV